MGYLREYHSASTGNIWNERNLKQIRPWGREGEREDQARTAGEGHSLYPAYGMGLESSRAGS